jgi:hypothetical protein
MRGEKFVLNKSAAMLITAELDDVTCYILHYAISKKYTAYR